MYVCVCVCIKYGTVKSRLYGALVYKAIQNDFVQVNGLRPEDIQAGQGAHTRHDRSGGHQESHGMAEQAAGIQRHVFRTRKRHLQGASGTVRLTHILEASFHVDPLINLDFPLQGGTKQGLPLTAYTLIALHENRVSYTFESSGTESFYLTSYCRVQEHYSAVAGVLDSVRQAQATLERSYANVDDTYTLAIVTYALQLVNSPRRDAAFQQLASRARFGGDDAFGEKKPFLL